MPGCNAAADGFFSVYCDIFRKLHEQEKTAKHGDVPRPDFGGAGSEVNSVTAFYAYWLHFSSGRSDRAFAQHDKWDLREAPSPMMRRLMHQKNMAVREKARTMFNDKARRRAVPLLRAPPPVPLLPLPSSRVPPMLLFPCFSRACNDHHTVATRRAAWLRG